MIIVVLENDLVEYQKIYKAILEWGIERDIDYDIFHYQSGESFFSDTSHYDASTELFLLDIEMNQMNGIEVAKKLRMHNYKGDIIFLTAHKEYVFEGYQVHALNYLLKPVDKTKLFSCLSEIEEKYHGNCYTYKDKEQDNISIPYSSILYISVNRHYVYIYTAEKTYEQYTNLNALIQKLPYHFVQVHRSYIVNLQHIQKYSNGKIHLSDGGSLEVGRTYLKEFKNRYFRYVTRFD